MLFNRTLWSHKPTLHTHQRHSILIEWVHNYKCTFTWYSRQLKSKRRFTKCQLKIRLPQKEFNFHVVLSFTNIPFSCKHSRHPDSEYLSYAEIVPATRLVQWAWRTTRLFLQLFATSMILMISIIWMELLLFIFSFSSHFPYN